MARRKRSFSCCAPESPTNTSTTTRQQQPISRPTAAVERRTSSPVPRIRQQQEPVVLTESVIATYSLSLGPFTQTQLTKLEQWLTVYPRIRPDDIARYDRLMNDAWTEIGGIIKSAQPANYELYPLDHSITFATAVHRMLPNQHAFVSVRGILQDAIETDTNIAREIQSQTDQGDNQLTRQRSLQESHCEIEFRKIRSLDADDPAVKKQIAFLQARACATILWGYYYVIVQQEPGYQGFGKADAQDTSSTEVFMYWEDDINATVKRGPMDWKLYGNLIASLDFEFLDSACAVGDDTAGGMARIGQELREMQEYLPKLAQISPFLTKGAVRHFRGMADGSTDPGKKQCASHMADLIEKIRHHIWRERGQTPGVIAGNRTTTYGN